MHKTLAEAGLAVAELVGREAELHPEDTPKVNVDGVEELVADKGYHSGSVLEQVKALEVSTYIPERKQAGKRNWDGKQSEQQAVEANRSRVTGDYGKQLLRRRGEFLERSFAHCYETGSLRRPALHIARTREYFEASADPHRRVQHQPGAAEDVGSRQAPRAEKPRGNAYFGELYTLLPAGTCQLFVRDPGSYRLPQQRIDPVERMNLHVPLVEPERELVYIAL